MALSYQMMWASVYLFGPDANGVTWDGTGFFITIRSRAIKGRRYGYLVTAHHVVDGLTTVYMIAPNANDGSLYAPKPIAGWMRPIDGVDLALAPMPEEPEGDYSAIELEESLMPNERLDIGGPQLGSMIHYVGLFQPAMKMMARSGSVGAHNATLEGHARPIHLLDCRSYGGFSGSPCWAELSYPILTPKELPHDPPPGQTKPVVGQILYVSMMCGMFVAHYTDEDDDGNITNEDGTVSRYGVGVMVRGDEIKEALMSDELAEQRRTLDEE